MKLRPYQEAGRDFLASRRHALLADEMRVGKTPQAILAAEKIGARKIIVICPAIAVQHWHNEWAKWSEWDAPVPTVVSYYQFRLHANTYLAGRYDLAIVDEAHYAGNPAAQRTQLIYGNGGLGWHADRMWVLSGTPAKKSAAELWPMFSAFGVTKLDYVDFVRRYCTYYISSHGRRGLQITGTKTVRIPELKALLATIMLRRTRRDVAPDMPAIGFEFLEMSGSSQSDYDSVDVLDYEDGLGVGVTRHEIAMSKVRPLADEITFAIENGLLKQTVVFGWHTAPLEALAATLFKRGITTGLITGATGLSARSVIQAEFRTGGIQVLVANILAAGTAIDLSAASHGYFLELDWLPANNVQAANRLISLDKHEPVTFDIATRPGTVDDAVQRIVLRRSQELARIYLSEKTQETT